MSNSQFKSLKNEVVVKPSPNGRLWQIQSDKHVAAITINFDKTSRANQIAAKPEDHPVRDYFKIKPNQIFATDIEQTAAIIVDNDLSLPDHKQNHYSFTMNNRAMEKEFSKTAKDIVANALLPRLVQDAKNDGHDTVFIYPTEEVDTKGIEWLQDAFTQSIVEQDVAVLPCWVQTAEKKKVRGIYLIFMTAVPEIGAKAPASDKNVYCAAAGLVL